MSEHRILLIENPASLSIDLGRLRVRREGFEDVFISPDDIAVLCLHHHTIQVSVQALRLLAQAGASVIVTDEMHHPCASLLPQVGNGDLVRRLRQQMALDSKPEKAILWQALVKARLNTQATNLRVLNRRGALRLERLAMEVQPLIRPNVRAKAQNITGHIYWMTFPEKNKARKTPSMLG